MITLSCLLACLSISLSSNLPSISLYLYLFIYLPIYLYPNLPIYLSNLSMYLFTYLPIYLSIYSSSHLYTLSRSSITLSIYQFIVLSTYFTLRKSCGCREICTDLAKVLRLPRHSNPDLRVAMRRVRAPNAPRDRSQAP